jgi:hypothetical protein
MFNFVLLQFRRTIHNAAVISALVLILPAVGRAQDKPSAPADSAKVLAAAREIMTAQR